VAQLEFKGWGFGTEPLVRFGSEAARDVEVLRPNWSQYQNFGVGLEGKILVSISVSRVWSCLTSLEVAMRSLFRIIERGPLPSKI